MNINIDRLWVVVDITSNSILFCSPNYNQAKLRYDYELREFKTCLDSVFSFVSVDTAKSFSFSRTKPVQLLRYDLSRHYLSDLLKAADDSLVSDFRSLLEFAFGARPITTTTTTKKENTKC